MRIQRKIIKKTQLLWKGSYLEWKTVGYYRWNIRTERIKRGLWSHKCKEQPAQLKWSLSLIHWRNCSETVHLYETWPL